MNTKTEKCIFAKIDELQKGLSRIEAHYNQHIVKDHCDTIMPISQINIVDSNKIELVSRLQNNLNFYIRKTDDLRNQLESAISCAAEASANHKKILDAKNAFIMAQSDRIQEQEKQIRGLKKDIIQPMEEDSMNDIISRKRLTELKATEKKYNTLVLAVLKSKED